MFVDEARKLSGKAVAFYIRKTANGISSWLKRLSPAIVWGPKSQAMKFTTRGAARLALQNMPKQEQVDVIGDAAGESIGD